MQKLGLILLSLVFTPLAWADISTMVKAVEEVNTTRESLVKSVPEKPTGESFKAACKPVGMMAKKLAKKNGWKFRQVSFKNRNPKNAPAGKMETNAINHFLKNPKKMGFWQEGPQGIHYFRRITVRQDCLGCHGAKDKRPGFITKKYPHDKAFDFKVGDLRGIYHVAKMKK